MQVTTWKLRHADAKLTCSFTSNSSEYYSQTCNILCHFHLLVPLIGVLSSEWRLPLMSILNALVIALVIILDTTTKQLFSQRGCNKYWRDAPRLYPPFYLIASDCVTMAGYWTVADEHFATRQTEDVSIIWDAWRSSTYDKQRAGDIRDHVQFNLRTK